MHIYPIFSGYLKATISTHAGHPYFKLICRYLAPSVLLVIFIIVPNTSFVWFLFNRFKDSTTLNVVSLSKILLVCPNPATVPVLQHNNIPKESLFENIWMVDKKGYETCTADTSRSGTRLLKTCDKPLDLKYLQIVFQFYSATPSGLEFVPGKEYYFISKILFLS